jgi:DNA ligase (NAD+)
MTKIEQIQGLISELNECRDKYYNQNNPAIPDWMYDSLFDKLKILEQETEYIQSDSPTQTVGYTVISKLQKVQHSVPLKSLDKTKDVNVLNQWRKNKDIILMAKADGLTVELDYENGELAQASTRGDGNIGEDITHNARTFIGLPVKIPFQGKLKVVGEAIIHRNDFDEINSKLPDVEKYKTPRNLAAGSVRQLDSKICSERKVYFYAFNILECDEALSDSKCERFKWLGNLGFYIISNTKIKNDSKNLNICIESTKAHVDIIQLPIDGLVASFDSVEYSNSLGETSHHPLHSLAFKFEDETAETTLRDIEWSLGRTGVITPVAIFDTVELDGTEVSRASLHNLSIIENLELGLLDRISVQKCNMIIPQIQENFTRSNTLEIPTECPECGGITIIEQLNESKVLYCTNPNCAAKLLGKMAHFVSRQALNIDGLSEATLEKFIENGFVKEFADIYKLGRYKHEIINMDGFGAKSYTKLIVAIETSRYVKMENFLYALGIPQIGRSASKTISKYFNGSWFDFVKALSEAFIFTILEDFGSVMHFNLYEWFNKEYMCDCGVSLQYVDLVSQLSFVKDEPKIANEMKDLSGLAFVITGSVNTFENRDKFKDLVESLNGKVSGSVSKNTSFLVSNEASGSSKSKKAQELGVKVITEVEFNEMIGREV